MDQGAFRIRPLNTKDFEWMMAVTKMAGAGFTSLPNDPKYIQRRLEIVEQSFAQAIPVEERIYLFVRENIPSGDRVGICGIQANVGFHESFYNYQISTITQLSKENNIYIDHRLLNLVSNYQSASELISFWMHPLHRGQNLSKSLALSRFMFIAHNSQLFGKELIAEIRGVCDDDGNSPFWDALGSKFFAMDFKTADSMTMTKGKQYIADLVSHEPIYLDLLSKEAQAVVGVAHPTAEPARHFLESQGFVYNNHIDIFDAGPLLCAETAKVKSITESKIAILGQCLDKMHEGEHFVIYNCRFDARFTVAKLIQNSNGEISIAKSTAEILDVKSGDQLRYCVVY